MDLQTIIDDDKFRDKSMAIAGLQYCNSLQTRYERLSAELAWLISDPAIGPLMRFTYCYRNFYDQCLEYGENPSEANKEILQKYFNELNKACLPFEK